ncbi:hypothetical protein [Streptomyces sp. NBC_01451]|uniref:hypothetical protein n=1 Tax=Streptomyces sp. NBC_01451 TaxID=2903872 RepID=UPI002E3542F2|nr:hypothetical protein [Streptomyces sp. NBC_01451]
MTFVEEKTSFVEISAALIRNDMKNSTAAAIPSMERFLSKGEIRVPRYPLRRPQAMVEKAAPQLILLKGQFNGSVNDDPGPVRPDATA